MIPRLGVNIDHVATLRQARGEFYPRTDTAAKHCFSAGADQLTIHLREDRRHIQDHDVVTLSELLKKLNKPLNLEIGLSDEIILIAKETAPDWLCIVPEKREEKTTEGGLDLKNDDYFDKVKKACDLFKKEIPQTKISLFVEADSVTLKRSSECSIDAVEIHTGEYAKAFLENESYAHYIDQYKSSQEFCAKVGLGHHAGHGLTFESVRPLLKEKLFVEYNIGHAMMAQSLFDGMSTVVAQMKTLFCENEL
jgi:pyridoxine 5-phosphate synthase